MLAPAKLSKAFRDGLAEQSRWLVVIWITVIPAAAAMWFKRLSIGRRRAVCSGARID
jgi:hypothetical protein